MSNKYKIFVRNTELTFL